MHTPAAADSDVAPIWADVDVHRGPGRRGRGAPGAAPWAPTPHDAAGGMAPVLGALGAQIVMAEALGAPAPALNVGPGLLARMAGPGATSQTGFLSACGPGTGISIRASICVRPEFAAALA